MPGREECMFLLGFCLLVNFLLVVVVVGSERDQCLGMGNALDLMAHLVREDQREFLIVSDPCDHGKIVFSGDGVDFHDSVDLQEFLDDIRDEFTLDLDKNNCRDNNLGFF